MAESSPIETYLDHADIPDVGLETIRGVTATLGFAEFYASNAPNSRLEAVSSR